MECPENLVVLFLETHLQLLHAQTWTEFTQKVLFILVPECHSRKLVEDGQKGVSFCKTTAIRMAKKYPFGYKLMPKLVKLRMSCLFWYFQVFK